VPRNVSYSLADRFASHLGAVTAAVVDLSVTDDEENM
jgi:hypothetical protein